MRTLVGGGQSLGPSNNKRFGFTLAEVLITLGIIGVVAALTLPTLIQKYQKQVWVNQLKKSVSTFDNGFKMMLADAGTDDLLNTEFWQKLQEQANGNEEFAYDCAHATADNLTANDEILKKYFKILSIGGNGEDISCYFDYRNVDLESIKDPEDLYAYKQLNKARLVMPITVGARNIQMADGTTAGLQAVAYAQQHPVYGDVVAVLAIDINGKNKGPNQLGRDAFLFYVTRKGVLMPSRNYESLKATPVLCGNIETGDISNAMGAGCEARIIHDGWKMNY